MNLHRLAYAVCYPLYEGLGIKLNPSQVAPITNQDMYPLLVGGERGSKSFASALMLLPHIVMLPSVRPERFFVDGKLKHDNKNDKPRNPDFLIFGPTYAEPRIEFQYIQNWLEELGLLADGINRPSKPQDGPWRMVTTFGVVIATWSMEDPRSIRAVDLEGAVVAEAGKCPLDGIYRVRGRVSAKRGFIIYNGTMENAQFWYPEWALEGKRPNDKGIKTYSLPTWGNLHEYPGGRQDPEIKALERLYPEDIFAMRVAAEPRALRERVITKVTEEHIRPREDVPEDANIEVWIDPGFASAYAVVFVAIWNEWQDVDGQRVNVGKRFHIFDEFYEQGRTTLDMIELAKAHPKWRRIHHGVIDVAAKGHRDAGESALEIWKKRTSLIWNMRYWKESAQIERIQSAAQQDMFTIDPKCVGLIAEMGLGRPVFDEMHPWKYPTDRDGKVIGEKPIDRWNHSVKAVAYGLLHHLGQVENPKSSKHISRMRNRRAR